MIEGKAAKASPWWRTLQHHYNGKNDKHDPPLPQRNLQPHVRIMVPKQMGREFGLNWNTVMFLQLELGLWRQVRIGVPIQEHPAAGPLGPLGTCLGLFPSSTCIVGMIHSSLQNPYKDFLTCRIKAMGRSHWNCPQPIKIKVRSNPRRNCWE